MMSDGFTFIERRGKIHRKCSCLPCDSPARSHPTIDHCAACCSGSLIEQYDHDCPIPEHRAMAIQQWGPVEEPELLTDDEHEALKLLAQAWNLIASTTTNPGDARELTADVHRIQNYVMARAAARAYPDRYRL